MGGLLSKNDPQSGIQRRSTRGYTADNLPSTPHNTDHSNNYGMVSSTYNRQSHGYEVITVPKVNKVPTTIPIKTMVGEVSSTVGCKMWDEGEMLAKVSHMPLSISMAFVKLLKEGNTLPFIARYRKDKVGNLTPDRLQDLFEFYQTVTELKKKCVSAIENLKRSNKLTPDVESSIVNAKSISELEFVYSPLKTHSVTLAQKARDLGLEQPALNVLNRQHMDIGSLCNPRQAELATPEKVEAHIIHILADIVYKHPKVVEYMVKLKEETHFSIESALVKSLKPKEEGQNIQSRSDPETYKLYYKFRCACKHVKSYQTLAINRGEDEKILTVKVIIPTHFYNKTEKFCLFIWKDSVYLRKALQDGYNRLIKPWLTRQVRSQLTAIAHKEATKTFSDNLEKYLLTEPIKGRCIAGLDPGFRAGCKIGIIDENGQKLYVCTLKPNLRTDAMFDRVAEELKLLLNTYNVEVIGLGNGTACRETESWLQKYKISNYIPVVIVPECGASVYSVSKEATAEHPNMDPNHISALSIARRVLDPLGELIKVEPKNLGVGMYQHDIPKKTLETALTATLERVVSLVGADLNTASASLLKRIAGLKENQVKNIIQYRQQNGRFKKREELMKVPGIGKVTFEQCAGFLRVLGGPEPLDSTIIHPESYGVAKKFAQKLALNLVNLCDSYFPVLAGNKISQIDVPATAAFLGIAESTMDIIISAFKRNTHEATISFAKPIYSSNVQGIEQAKAGMTLTGVVRNVVEFGCFVDCGLEDNGLIHRSNLGGHTLNLGDRVSVVLVSTPRPKRIQLRLLKILD